MDGFGICFVREGHQTNDPAIMIESIPSATYFVNPCDKCQIVLNNVCSITKGYFPRYCYLKQAIVKTDRIMR